MKNTIKKFRQFVNENSGQRRMYSREEAQVDISMDLGQTAAEMAEFLSHLAEMAPTSLIMEIEAENPSQNPNAGIVLTFAGPQEEIDQLDMFNDQNYGQDRERRFHMTDHPDDKGTYNGDFYMGED